VAAVEPEPEPEQESMRDFIRRIEIEKFGMTLDEKLALEKKGLPTRPPPIMESVKPPRVPGADCNMGHVREKAAINYLHPDTTRPTTMPADMVDLDYRDATNAGSARRVRWFDD
jgi:hypothetical protein